MGFASSTHPTELVAAGMDAHPMRADVVAYAPRD